MNSCIHPPAVMTGRSHATGVASTAMPRRQVTSYESNSTMVQNVMAASLGSSPDG